MIIECEAGHAYENIPVTEGFHDIPKRCHICGAQITSVKLTGSSAITGAGGFAGMPPPSEWSTQAPLEAGWYWDKEAEKNMGKPVAARVFCNDKTLHVSIFLLHDESPRHAIGQPHDFPGEWSGPVDMPK